MGNDDTLLELLLWQKGLRETNNASFLPLFGDESRYLVLKGGGGSGKSIFAGRKILERSIYEGNHRFLVCRKVGRTLRDSCFKQLIGELNEYYPGLAYKANQSDMRITFPVSQSEILFSGLDDVEKLKSIYNITGIWIEEASELLESDFNQLDIRLRGETAHYKQIILTFNPISIVHWLKARFFDRKMENCTIHESTYKDNRFLDEENIRVLEGYKDTDPYYYTVYCLGHWGVTGKTVFNGESLTARLLEVRECSPLKKRGRMVFDYDGLKIRDMVFEEDDNGSIRVYREPLPGRPYVMGVDTAGDGSDSAVIQVIDAITMEQCLTMRDQDMNEDIFARQVYAVGMWYNTALVAVESNYSTYPIIELERLHYPKQYVREVYDDATHKIQLKYGFQTNPKTRPVLISHLQKVARENVRGINDEVTLEEMLTFVRNPDTMRPEAEEGAHDDTVMALAIACLVRDSGQIRLYVEAEAERDTEWTESMLEDYRNASKADREQMIERWGKPKKWNRN